MLLTTLIMVYRNETTNKPKQNKNCFFFQICAIETVDASVGTISGVAIALTACKLARSVIARTYQCSVFVVVTLVTSDFNTVGRAGKPDSYWIH